MQDFLVIVRVPGELHPRNVQLVIKFVKEFHEKGFILDLEVEHSKASSIFGLHTISHAARELHFSPWSVFLIQRHLLLILSSISMTFGGNFNVHIA